MTEMTLPLDSTAQSLAVRIDFKINFCTEIKHHFEGDRVIDVGRQPSC